MPNLARVADSDEPPLNDAKDAKDRAVTTVDGRICCPAFPDLSGPGWLQGHPGR